MEQRDIQGKNNYRPLTDQQWRVSGNWEPKMFLYRRGDGTFIDVEKLWQNGHSEQAIERLKNLGINFSHIHFHKGYGLEHESASIAEAASWAEKLHANGINVGVYIGSTFFEETFKHPNFDNMVMQNGNVGWNGPQYFRKFWCYNSPLSIEYFKKVIKTAIEKVNPEIIHFDNSFCFYHDQLCRCEHCQTKFKEFLQNDIPDIIAAGGYDKAEHIMPPYCGNLQMLASVTEAKEPGDIAWTLFHAKAGYLAAKSLIDYAKNLKPDIFFLYNGASFCGITSFSRPHMEMEMMSLVDATCVEDEGSNPVKITEEGMPISRFRAYKVGSRTKTRVNYYTVSKGHNNRLRMAESAAFNYRSLGFVETVMQTNHRLKEQADIDILKYFSENQNLFLDREPRHNIAVLRHHESMTLNPFPSALSPYVIEQILFEEHAAFSIIGKNDLDAEKLKSEFNLLILPDCKCLSDTEVEQIISFTKAGGSLLTIGNTALSTPLNQFRRIWPLAEIFHTGSSSANASYDETADSTTSDAEQKTASRITTACFGKGKAVHIPKIDFQFPDKTKVKKFAGFDWYSHPYWKSPANRNVIIEQVKELLDEKIMYQADLPIHVGVESYKIDGGFCFTFVNYVSPTPVEPSKYKIRINLTQNENLKVNWHSPQNNSELNYSTNGDNTVTIKIPSFELLGVLTVKI